jgi:hypothetical protein
MNQPIFNPWAPPLLNGFNPTSPDGCEDVDAAYVWPENNGFQTMTANQQLTVAIALDNDDDFRFMAFQWSLKGLDDGLNTPGFLYRIQDDAGNFISDGFEYCFCTPGTFANPWPMFPHVTYAVHQRIQFEVINLHNDVQGVQIVFRGPKRFRRVA